MTNSQIASFFKKLADLLEIKGDNPFRIRAYRNAARTIETSGYDFVKLVHQGYDLSRLPDIGERIAKKISEIVTTGKLTKLEEVQKQFPEHILDLLKIEGIGPKRARILYERLGIGSLEDLKKAAQAHKIRQLPGFDEKLEEKILKGVVLYKKEGRRFLYFEAEPYAHALEHYLKASPAVKRLTVAGSFRRRKETVGDLDIVATSDSPLEVMDRFVAFDKVKEVVSKGDTRSTVILENNLQIDFRVVSEQSYGAALHYFTGSKAHNIAIRKMAVERGWKVNEYGVFDRQMQRIAGAEEEEIYALFGMDYIEPELREDRGELEAAARHALPRLVCRKDLRGDLHVHSHFGLGSESPESLVRTALELGYEYIAVTDRYEYLLSDHGRKRARLDEYLDTLERLQKRYPRIRILKGVEIGITKEGAPEAEEKVLERFEWVVGSLDDAYHLGKEEQTRRIVRAIEEQRIHLLAHPTGRIIGKRNGYSIDLERIVEAAKKHSTALEIDSRPDRLDLSDVSLKPAKERGAPLVVSSDARNTTEMEWIRYGIHQARRGWIEASDLLNTRKRSTFESTIQGAKR